MVQEFSGTLSVVITDSNGNEFNIDTGAITTLYFIEDVFSFCITGKVKFTDYGGVMEMGNFWGYQKEVLTIVYGIPKSGRVEKEFKIYKIDKQTPSHTRLSANNVYEITFVSKLYYQWHFKQYSRSFKDMKTTDILKHIMKHMIEGEFFNIEEANERIGYFYTGLKSPAENFKFLMERSTGIKSGKPGYLCFENMDGYNLITLPSLMNSSVDMMQPNDGDNIRYWFDTDNLYLYNKVSSFDREGVDNSSMQQLSGGNRLGYDILRKKNILKLYTYKDSRNKFKDNLLGNPEYPLLDPDITGRERFIKTGENDEVFMDNIYYNNWIKQYSTQQLIMLYVKGHEKRKAGGVIDIVWPSINKDKNNLNFTGKYFVKSVVHYLFNDKDALYNQKLVLMKNAYDGVNIDEK